MSQSSFGTADAAGVDSRESDQLPWESDEPVDVPSLSSLFELESNCELGKSDSEFWRTIAVGAAHFLCLEAWKDWSLDKSEWERAIRGLKARRYRDWDELCLEDAEAAICGEINCFIRSVFEKDDMTTTKARKITHQAKADPPETKFDEIQQSERSFAELKAAGKSRAKDTELPRTGPRPLNVQEVALNQLFDSPYQTRQEPSAESIEQLAESLKRDGQRDPIRVRPVGTKYELIGGHRRTRAARLLKWPTINAVILEVDDAEASRLVWDDNRQREDLNSIERAKGLKLIWEQYQAAGKSMDQMAVDVGLDQSTISNRIRLLAAPESLQQRLISGEITESRLRDLAKWARFDGLIERFEKELDLRESNGPIGRSTWETALRIAIYAYSRPAAKFSYSFGPVCSPDDPQFDIEKHAADLDIVEFTLDDEKDRRCFNVKLWKKLQAEAKNAKKAKEKAKADKKTSAVPDKTPRTNRDSWQFERELRNAWIEPLWIAIGEHITSAKMTKPERAIAIRMVHFLREPEMHWVVETISMSADEYTEACLELIEEDWADSCPWGATLATLQPIAARYGIDLTPRWTPPQRLLEACELCDLQEMADELKISHTGSKSDVITRLLMSWPPGHVPELLAMEAPKPSKSTKKGKK